MLSKKTKLSKVFKVISLMLVVVTAALLVACGGGETTETLTQTQTSTQTQTQTVTETPLYGKLQIYHAGSLTIPFAEISDAFNEIYPDVEILAEGAGSATTIRKVTELGKECGVIGSADYSLIPKLMYPDFADWYIIFASNQMCLTYTDSSAFADEVNSDNWYDILQEEGVTYGRSDPDQDPCGYRTLMVWQLAEIHYDAAGLYDSLFEAEGDLTRALPSEINLADVSFSDFYAQAEVGIAGAEPGETITMIGKPIVYGVTIPSNFQRMDLAIAWVDFLLSSEGVAIMEANGQPPITPAVTDNIDNLPEELKKYVE